jgi:hypothetical protein
MKPVAFLATMMIAFAAALSSSPADAQNVRSFVSAAAGSDGNACTRSAPCRTFAGAITKTNAGGEISTLDPGGYGPVTITKAISIVGGFGEAGVLVPSGSTAITVSAGAGDVINLRGLVIEGAGLGSIGIRFLSGGALNIQKCVIRNLLDGGIFFTPSSNSYLYVTDTLISDVTSNSISVGAGAVLVGGSASMVKAEFTRVSVENSWFGITASGFDSTGSVAVTIADSAVTGSQRNGIEADTSPSTAPVTMMVKNSSVVNGALIGVVANGAGAVVRLSGATIMQNLQGWSGQFGGIVSSYGNNNIDDNGDLNSAPPAIAMK